jgi:hypothetical protein
MNRFRADFTSEIAAQSYVEWKREEWDVYGTPFYPVGGMSAFIDGMLNAAISDGGQAFSSEKVKIIKKTGTKYRLETTRRLVIADKVVIAVPPVGLEKITGTIADQIKRSPQFKSLQPIPVVTVQNWWTSPWWSTVNRAQATPETGFNFNSIEFAYSDYQKDQLATRSVYNDDPRTIDLWVDAYKAGGAGAVNTMIVNQLTNFFPGATVSESQITKTHFEDWKGGWYYLKKGSSYSNADIAIWALEPLSGEHVSLVSDAYNPNRSTWSDGAFKSAINTLNRNFDQELACASVVEDANGLLEYVRFNDGSYVCPCLAAECFE